MGFVDEGSDVEMEQIRCGKTYELSACVLKALYLFVTGADGAIEENRLS